MAAKGKDRPVESYTGIAGPTLGITQRSPEDIEAARANVRAYAADLGLGEAETAEVADEILATLGLLD